MTIATLAAAAHRLRQYPNALPLVLAAVPDAGAEPLGARAIAEKTQCCAASTVRSILADAVRVGLVQSDVVATPQGCKRVYTRMPALAPDSFEDSPNVYAPEIQTEPAE